MNATRTKSVYNETIGANCALTPSEAELLWEVDYRRGPDADWHRQGQMRLDLDNEAVKGELEKATTVFSQGDGLSAKGTASADALNKVCRAIALNVAPLREKLFDLFEF